MCEPLTRRQLLKYTAMVAATFPIVKVGAEGWSLAAQAQVGVAVPMNLELVTVTDTSAILTWFTGDPTQPDQFGRPAPVAAPGRVLIGTSPLLTDMVEVGAHEPTPYHYVEIDGLTPGVSYFFRAESNGVPATATTLDPTMLLPSGLAQASFDTSNAGTFTTLVPPSGALLSTVAWFNDLHIGEGTSGLAVSNDAFPGGGVPPGFAADPDNPYWRFMAEAAIAEARARGCTVLLANGDLTSEAEPDEVAEARRQLDEFGVLAHLDRLGPDSLRLLRPGHPSTYFVTRGNHDRVHDGDLWADCSRNPRFNDLFDCFRDAFEPSFDAGSSHWAVGLGSDTHRFRFVGLDSNDVGGNGVLPDHEVDFLKAHLDSGDAVIPLFHHIVGDESTATAIPPAVFGVERNQAAAFRTMLGTYENVAGVYTGHTHRNNRTTSLETGGVPYFEGGAVKEYPGGYTVVRLYEGGYMVNFHTCASPEARAWAERSRGEYLGLYPYYTFGSLGDRNWTYDMDARIRSGAVAGPAPSVAPTPSAAPSAAPSSGTGGSPSLDPTSTASGPALPSTGGGAAAVGAAAISAAAFAASARRRNDGCPADDPA